MAARINFGQQLLPQLIGCRRLVVVVVDPQAATKIDVSNRYADRFNRINQVKHAVHGVQVRRYLGDLRANVAVNAHHM